MSADDRDRLSEAERRDLRCFCTRLDDVWQHRGDCLVPHVERILAARAQADPEQKCWRGECRESCYYPDCCSEAKP